MLGGRGWQLRPTDIRKTHACALKNRAILQNLRVTLTLQHFSFVFLPGVAQKSSAIDVGQGLGDAALQTNQVGMNLWDRVHGGLKIKGGVEGGSVADGQMANVASVLLAVKSDFLHAHIGLFLRGTHRAAQSGDTQHPPALGG